MLWAVVSSARCKARRLDSPVPSMSAITQLLRRYRRGISGLEPFHIWRGRRGIGLPARNLFEGCYQLVGVLWIRGIAAALQGIGEGAHVGARAQCLGVPRFPKYADIIRDVFRERAVGAKPGAFGAGLSGDEFGGIGGDARALPAGTGLDAKEVVTAAARVGGLRSAPAGVERGLRDDGARIHAQLACRGGRMRQHLVDKLALLHGRDAAG